MGANPRDGFPTVYISGDQENVRISIGDSFRGMNKFIVYPTHYGEHESWEIVIFEGSIAVRNLILF